MKNNIPWEGINELCGLYLLEVDPEIVEFWPQPKWMTLLVDGEYHDHCPDLLAVTKNNGSWYLEMKSDDSASEPEFIARSKVAKRFLARHGVGYHVFEAQHLRADAATGLTVCRGSTDERDDLHVVFSNVSRSMLWVADSTGDKIETVLSIENSDHFVVRYESARGEVFRKKDGRKIADLSGAISRAKFLPDGHHLVAWYKNGRSELWELGEDDAVILAPLQLPVSDVLEIPGTSRLVVLYDDGRAYLIDVEWLSEIRTLTARRIAERIRDHLAGPASSPWWQTGQPAHYPWKKLAPVEPEPDAADLSDASQ